MKNVLLVDDSATARLFLRRCLEIAGLTEAEYFEAPNAEEALSLLQRQRVDLVITDLSMPGMGGEGLLRALVANPELSRIPVVIASSAINRDNEQRLLNMGACAVLGKPFKPASAVDILRRLGWAETASGRE